MQEKRARRHITDNTRTDEEEDAWALYYQQYELWQQFMRAACGIGPAFDTLLMKMMSGVYIEDEHARLIPADQTTPPSDTRFVTCFDHIVTRYKPDSEGQESLEASNFAYHLDKNNTAQDMSRVVMERAKAALALAGQAHALGWDAVDLGETQSWLENYLLQSACAVYGIEYYNAISPERELGVEQKELTRIDAHFKTVYEAPMDGDQPEVGMQHSQATAPPHSDSDETAKAASDEDPFIEEASEIQATMQPQESGQARTMREINSQVSSRDPDWCHFHYSGDNAPETPVYFHSTDEVSAAGSTLLENIFKMRTPAIACVRLQHANGLDIISLKLKQEETTQDWTDENADNVAKFLKIGLDCGKQLQAEAQTSARAFNTESARALVRDKVSILSRDGADIVIDPLKDKQLQVRMGGPLCHDCGAQELTKHQIKNALRQAYPAALRDVKINISVSEDKPEP